MLLLLFVGCLMSQQHASVSQGRICSNSFTCCHTEIEVADQTFHLTQSQYTDTGPTCPSTDPIPPCAWQGSQWECQFLSHWYDLTLEKSRRKQDLNSGSSTLKVDAVTTRPMRWWEGMNAQLPPMYLINNLLVHPWKVQLQIEVLSKSNTNTHKKNPEYYGLFSNIQYKLKTGSRGSRISSG